MASEFVCTPMDDEPFQKQGEIPEGSPGKYNGSTASPFSEYERTSSPNAVREKFFEKAIGKISGEGDQFGDEHKQGNLYGNKSSNE